MSRTRGYNNTDDDNDSDGDNGDVTDDDHSGCLNDYDDITKQ